MNKTNSTEIPLYVDLDGTLIKTDLLFECLIEFIKKNPFNILLSIKWLLKGKAYLKSKLADNTSIDIKKLPYNEPFLSYLKNESSQGRKIILATASNFTLARRISDHLNIFSDIIASDERKNIKGKTKLQHIKENSGNSLFDYAGNSKDDLIIFKHANASILVNFDKQLPSRSTGIRIAKSFDSKSPVLRNCIIAIRPHQWVKNLLIFVPLFVSNQWYSPNLIIRASIGFISFSLIASAVYVINDISDIQNDRTHIKKKYRPFAASNLAIGHGLIIFLFLVSTGLFAGYLIDRIYFFLLVTYIILNLLYSVYLKSLVLIDILILSQFYTLRVISGGVITNIELSFWLLAFSVFVFFSLSIAKRYTELISRNNDNKTRIKGRGYTTDDINILNIMGVTNGYLAVLVLALYINSPQVVLTYSSPKILWGVCVIFFFWISYVWIKANRGELEEDPITFAIKDRTSLVVFVLLIIDVIFAVII
jgi:4-hydroxybenzoate polyprenyltransferase